MPNRSLRPLALPGLLLLAACTRATFVPTDAAADPAGETLAEATPADRPDGTDARDLGRTCPAPALPGCVPSDAGPCDPVCQIGGCDFCTQKCSYVLAAATATAACVPTGTGSVMQACTISAAGSAAQADNCAPGTVCLAPVIGDSARFCFALCRSSADCPYGVACAARKLSAAGGNVDVCDPPYDQCGPDGTCCNPLSGSGCPADRVCLLVDPDPGTGHSRTVCELAYGDGRNGAPCSTARDCQLRNACVNGHCQQVCDATAPCPGGSTCTRFGSEFGYCP